jgi:hypothetical protein
MATAIPTSEISDWEDYNMHHAHRYISSLFLAAALATPVAIMAAAGPQDARVEVRVYDRDHKDYHTWDDNENRAYTQYRSENPKSAHEFREASKKEQSHYWNWRHSHPDKD